jgi:hypothetical protein
VEGRGSNPGRAGAFCLRHFVQIVVGYTQTPIQWVSGALSPGIKRPGNEADYSPPPSAEIECMEL